jgi:hypothetical protein
MTMVIEADHHLAALRVTGDQATPSTVCAGERIVRTLFRLEDQTALRARRTVTTDARRSAAGAQRAPKYFRELWGVKWRAIRIGVGKAGGSPVVFASTTDRRREHRHAT